MFIVMTLFVAFAPVAVPAPSLAARLWSVANSAIFIAVIATAIAAFAGTYGAQALADKTARRKELLAEIRATNTAIGLTFNIVNTYIGTKSQQVKDMAATFELNREKWLAHCAGISEGKTRRDKPFDLQIQLKRTTVAFSPIEDLQRLLQEKISSPGKALLLLTPLIQSIHSFTDVTAQRNSWIEEFKRLPINNDDPSRAHLYFGTSFQPNDVDERYFALVMAMKAQVDDCIGFGIKIAESLKISGESLAAELGQDAPKIFMGDFSPASDLLPDMVQYEAWASGITV